MGGHDRGASPGLPPLAKFRPRVKFRPSVKRLLLRPFDFFTSN
jgi:hypothetical protein